MDQKIKELRSRMYHETCNWERESYSSNTIVNDKGKTVAIAADHNTLQYLVDIASPSKVIMLFQSIQELDTDILSLKAQVKHLLAEQKSAAELLREYVNNGQLDHETLLTLASCLETQV